MSISSFARFAGAAALLSITALGAAQSTNTVVARYGVAPTGNDFTVRLSTAAPASTVSGFAFKVCYDSNQVALTGTGSDITGQPASRIQFSLGPEVAEITPAGTNVCRVVAASTRSDLKNATGLVELKFSKKPGFTAPLKLVVKDRLEQPVVDGLQDGTLQNIPHAFDVSAVTK